MLIAILAVIIIGFVIYGGMIVGRLDDIRKMYELDLWLKMDKLTCGSRHYLAKRSKVADRIYNGDD